MIIRCILRGTEDTWRIMNGVLSDFKIEKTVESLQTGSGNAFSVIALEELTKLLHNTKYFGVMTIQGFFKGLLFKSMSSIPVGSNSDTVMRMHDEPTLYTAKIVGIDFT